VKVESGEPLTSGYRAFDISKSFGGAKALSSVDLDIRAGEVHALLGANGAGKSTLMKILVGAVAPDSGVLELDGVPVQFRSTAEAAEAGVGIVSQELNLFPDLTVLSNLFILREPRTRLSTVNRRQMAAQAGPVLDLIGFGEPLDAKVGDLPLSERQLLEIARSLLLRPKVLILDEPTSALGPTETQRLLRVVRTLRDSGVGIVYVSHFLEDVFAIADSMTILRNGAVQERRRPVSEMTIRETISSMLGREMATPTERLPRDRTDTARPAGECPLVMRDAHIEGLSGPIHLDLAPGEVVGFAGLEGSGASAVLDLLVGRRRLLSGDVSLANGRRVPRSFEAAIKSAVAYVPADRKRHGLMLDKSIQENASIVVGGPLRRLGFFLRGGVMAAIANKWRARLGIAMSSPRARVGDLSGGNQQKVVFAKWLEGEPELILLDDPTRGVDVGARTDMHGVINDLAVRGRTVLITSSDLDELATVCDRVLVFVQRELVRTLAGEELTEHRLLEAINTGKTSASASPPESGAPRSTSGID
jgi:ABC-type sugar transport system ATPase subunit